MNERIFELAGEAGLKVESRMTNPPKPFQIVGSMEEFEKFAELIVAEAFRAGMMYSAKKYADEGSEHFTGNDVAMFLEMEACELSDEDIKQHFGVEE
jgi:hypothetical protein